ncbi:glucosamine-6-phosphate deaminase [Dyadobacter sediminis]|uniref:Glucosamine-6-phosphate deaminase n=1 Tax=Dyadobacter sediminis TaxID=1493691 RepID=A0A5R9KE97_9BACT|nr:glucosamine-6-phosphate deaminase [Dyadobacter sediminis]TLU94454.1 glucosamine-6-phosphate deaminase [Dyadobacter sediminis]GGB91096.1 glucosamine-6-phosphate isomerase [Dyadobacter sediminis]
MIPKISIYPDYEAMSLAAADRVIALLNHKPDAVICLPSGSTPVGMFRELVSASQKGNADFSRCIFVGLDEWVGLGGDDEGSGRYMINRDFLKSVGLKDNQVIFFDGKARDPYLECERINKIVSELGGLDLIVLGVGLNGHLALNEPGTAWNTYAHVVELDEVTKVTGQKYFSKTAVLEKGITMGIRHILEAKTAILLANGNQKAKVIQRALSFPVTPAFPATVLQNHLNAEFLLDREAGSLIDWTSENI